MRTRKHIRKMNKKGWKCVGNYHFCRAMILAKRVGDSYTYKTMLPGGCVLGGLLIP